MEFNGFNPFHLKIITFASKEYLFFAIIVRLIMKISFSLLDND